MIRRFGVQMFPTLLVLDAAGAVLDEVDGGEPADFVQDLARVLRGEETLPALRARLDADPADLAAAALFAEKLVYRRPGDAASVARAALERMEASPVREADEDAARLCLVLAEAAGQQGQAEACAAWLERLLDAFPGTEAASNARYVVGNWFDVLEPLRGLALLERAEAAAGPEAEGGMEWTRRLLLDRALSASYAREAERVGDDAEALNELAWECFRRGMMTDEAAGWAERAVRLSKRAPHVLDTLANLRFVQGRVDEALRLEAEALLALGPDDARRAGYEECFARFLAVHRLRAERAAGDR